MLYNRVMEIVTCSSCGEPINKVVQAWYEMLNRYGKINYVHYRCYKEDKIVWISMMEKDKTSLFEFLKDIDSEFAQRILEGNGYVSTIA